MSGRRIVWVIGAGSGIGLASASALCEAGDHVVLSGRDGSRLRQVARQLPGRSSVLPFDVRQAAAVDSAAGAVLVEHGRIDAVVLTAQVMAYGRIEDIPAEVFERVVDTATHGTANVARAVLPVFRRQAHGTLVIVNSLVGEIAVPQLSSYGCAKWGQLGLARSLQLEVRDAAGVEVCILSPGAIDTPIYDQAADYAGRRGHPPPPVLPPHRMAAAVVDCLQRPHRHREVGPANTVTVLGFRLMPWLYDRIVGPLVSLIIFRGPHVAARTGNVFAPDSSGAAERGGWTFLGRRRRSHAAPARGHDEKRA